MPCVDPLHVIRILKETPSDGIFCDSVERDMYSEKETSSDMGSSIEYESDSDDGDDEEANDNVEEEESEFEEEQEAESNLKAGEVEVKEEFSHQNVTKMLELYGKLLINLNLKFG